MNTQKELDCPRGRPAGEAGEQVVILFCCADESPLWKLATIFVDHPDDPLTVEDIVNKFKHADTIIILSEEATGNVGVIALDAHANILNHKNSDEE